MTADLDQIRARADAATPGSWVYKTTALSLAAVFAAPGMVAGCGSGEAADRDAEFIAHAREDIPALCDRLTLAETLLRNAVLDGDKYHPGHWVNEVREFLGDATVVHVEHARDQTLQAVLDLHDENSLDLGGCLGCHHEHPCPTRRLILGDG